ncbi:InlB B-repeat-containing protein [Streptomyces sp. NPDC054863]
MAQVAALPSSAAVRQGEADSGDSDGLLGPPVPESRSRAATQSPNPFLLRSELRKISRGATQQLCAPGIRLRLNLFKDVLLEAEPSTVKVSADGTSVSWHGKVASVPGSSVVLDGQNVCGSGDEQPTLSGTISMPGKLYALAPAGPGQVRAEEYNPGMFEIGEGGTRLRSHAQDKDKGTLSIPAPRSQAPGKAPSNPAGVFSSSETACAAKNYPVIDVMVVWSPQVTRNLGGLKGAEAVAGQGVGLMNEALANSKVKGRVRLVRAQEMSDYTGGEDDESALDALNKPDDGQLDNINELRATYGADLVSMLVTEGSGIGNTPAPPSKRTVNRAFSAVNHSYVPGHTMGHEMAHNLGAIHDWVASDEVTMANRPYNHGYAAPDKAWRTVMAYPAICDGCSRIPYFSNPRVTHPDGQVTGNADGDVKGPVARRPADNARLLDEMFSTVADYMETRIPVELCDMSVTSADTAQGTASTASTGPYGPGTVVTAAAVPAPGFVFVQWMLDGKPHSTDRRTTVKIAGDHRLVAYFTEGATPAHKVVARADSKDGGGVELSPAGPDFSVGSTVTASYFRWTGAKLPFVGWSVNGASAGKSRQITFTVDGPTEVVAHFSAVTSTLAASASPGNAGTLDLSSGGPYPPGTTVTVTASPAAGKIFSHWLLDGRRMEPRSPAGREEALDVVMGEESRALIAVFSDSRRIDVRVLPHAEAGTATWEPRRAEYAVGDKITVTASPKPGYDFTGWRLDNEPAGRSNPYVLTVRDDHELTAHFTKAAVPPTVTHRVSATAVPVGGGTVSLRPAKARYTKNDKVTATASPKPGYDFTGWRLDNEPAGRSDSLSLTVARDHHLTASFAPHKTVRTYKGRIIARTGLLVRDRPDQGGRIIGKLDNGKVVNIACKVKGQSVDGNPRWYRLTDGSYAWSSARYIANIGPAPHWC